MGHCVFMLHPDSIYDDDAEQQYQFPKQYLTRAEPSVGDWVVYLEPKKVRRTRGYFGIARVQAIVPDPRADGMFLARIEPGSFLQFQTPVPFNEGKAPIERGLLNEAGRVSGRAQAAVRPISGSDFLRIVEKGLAEATPALPRVEPPAAAPGLAEEMPAFEGPFERQRLLQLTSRPVRDRVFRRVILQAYGERCAVTGLKFINGGGRAEVDAAHILPVEHGGPDVVQNGLALSGTAHWMFDRGLISLTDDLEILVSRHVNDVDGVRAFINKTGRATPPPRPGERPHPRYLRWHRETCFKI